jgi:predicted hotdog family 3-hydroxylacyl-ACP dehydratase
VSKYPPPEYLLPHSAPMIFLDEVLEWKSPYIRCRLVVRAESLFLENNRVPVAVILEYMAQTIGAYVGLSNLSRGKPISIGYLLGTREMELKVDYLQVGDELILDAEHLFGEETVGSFRCTARRGEQLVAAAVLNVFQPPDQEIVQR